MHVLIVHFNTPDLTSRLVRDFPQQTPQGRTIVIHVLDNCSTSQNLSILRANIEGLQGVTLEVSNLNIGFGAGMNVLAENHAVDATDILWLLNPDTRLRAGCLELLEAELDSGDFAIVSPLIYSGDEADSWIWYCGGSISTRDLRPRHQLYGCQLADAPHSSFETKFVSGAAPMMRASTFRTVGGFPRGYFLYWEDTHFSWKARDLGFRLGVVPSAQLWHAVGASSGSGQTRTFYYWSARNRFAFASDIGVPRRRLIVGRGGLESLRPVAKALLEREGRLSKASAAIRGTLDGLRQAHSPS
jgi:N-acetylglucosaminyl-diphospho-decaprenol L-rhamnosyltransferase